MTKQLICLHAASANATLIEQAIPKNLVQLQHIVDTHLMKMIREHAPLDEQKEYAKKTIEVLLTKKPDILFITCTNYIALLEDVELYSTIPILKIDELWFEQLRKAQTTSIKLLFTNKETIEGTMARLKQYLIKPIDIEVILIPQLFDWYIAGDKKRHDEALLNYLLQLNDEHSLVAVAQLSMSDCAEQFNRLHQAHILHPIYALLSYLQN